MKLIPGKWSLALVTLFCLCTSAGAQTGRGWIQGEIRDKTNSAAIEGAETVLEDSDGRDLLAAKTNSSGESLFLGLPAGRYTLKVRKEGFLAYRINSIRVQDGSVSTVSVLMEGNKSGSPATVVLAWPDEPSDPWRSDRGSRFNRTRRDSLPSARNIWILLQNQDPTGVTNHLDEGGIQTGILPLVATHGGTWTQNGYRWDGLNITDPFSPGKPLAYPGYESLQEFRVSGASHSAALSAPGAELQLSSRRGSRTLRGEAEAYYLGDSLQSSNLDSRLQGFGFQTTPHFRQFPEGAFSLGGSTPRLRDSSFFTSLGIQHVSRVLPDFAAQPTTNIYSGLLRLDGRLRPQDELAMLVSGQIVRNSNLGAAAGIDPAATLHGNDRYELVQGHWTHRRGNSQIWDLSVGFSHASPTDTLQAGITKPSYLRLFTGETTGAAPVESDSALSRFSLLGQGQFFLGVSGAWRHQLALGFDLEESLATEEQRVYRGLNLFLFPGNTPAEVAEYNSPSHAKQRLREFSGYAEDRLEIEGRLFVRFGLKVDSSEAFLPHQISGAGAFVPVRDFPGAKDVVSWTTMSPRIGLTYPLWRLLGDTTLTAGYSRYYHILPAAYANYANPTALGGQIYQWNDSNQDGVFQPGERGKLLRAFGGPYSTVDPNLKRPFTDEYEVGLEHAFGRGLRASASLLRRDTKRLVHTLNIGVPFSAYTPVQVFDPGDDNIPGTSDDQILTAYNQDPGTLGQDRYLLTNPAGLNATYKGFETTLTGRPFERGFFSVSFAAYKSEGDGNPGNSEFDNDPAVIGTLFDNPNTLINARGRLYSDRAYLGKIAAYYQAPLGFRLGSVVSYFDGLPFGRKLIIQGFNQGPFFIMATPRGEPGGFRTQYYLDFDQRIAREFGFGRVRVGVLLDVFNLLNLNQNLREFDISGPLFVERRPTELQNPRAFRLAIKLRF